MLKPGEVIYDSRWAQVGRLQDASGRSFIRKVGKHPLGVEGPALLEFLGELVAHPHPSLLVPFRFSVAGDVIVEDYPDLSWQERLDRVAFQLRSDLARGALSVDQIVEFIVRLSDGVGFIHRHDLVHQDVRTRNVFLRREGERLLPTLFDYTFIVRPFFLVEGRLIADLEAPPEVRVGYVMLDGRYDVFQLGWMLRGLTHYEAGPDLWRPATTFPQELERVISRATGTLADRYPNADELRDDLDRLTQGRG
jgi:serine/threonine protein kinase